jgi:hypothetical protein
MTMNEINWIEGTPEKEGLYWVHDMLNGVLFAMVVAIDEEENGNNLYYYIMGCDMGFPVSQLSHYSPVTPPTPPVGTSHIVDLGGYEEEE